MQTLLTEKSVISKNFERKTGKEAWRSYLRLAVLAADKIRSSLGPKGAYKMVAYNRGPEQVVKVTKDATVVLDELAIIYPPAVIVAEAAKMQRDEAGDGVATFVVLLSALLRKADELLEMKIHPNTIVHGYYLAHQKALDVMESSATNLGRVDSGILDVVDCQRNLLTPSVRSMIMAAYERGFSDGKYEKDNVRFLRNPGGCVEESRLVDGVVLKKEKAHPNMPNRVKDLRIAIASEKPGMNRLQLKMKGEGPTPLRLNVTSAGQIASYRDAEDNLRLKALDKLFGLKPNVFICEQPLEEGVKYKLLSRGVFALDKVEKKDSEAVAKATGARIVGQLDELSEGDLGKAEELFTGQIGLEKTVTIQGCGGATFLLRGNTSQIIDELETAIRNSLTILKVMADDSRVLLGGGAVEAEMAREVKAYALSFPGREQVPIEFFADALMEIPRCLASNYGLNPQDEVVELKSRHANGFGGCGIAEGGCADSVCLEPFRVKRSIIRRAYEVSALMLRIDELLISKEIAKFHKK